MSDQPNLGQLLAEASRPDLDSEDAVFQIGLVIDAAHDFGHEATVLGALALCDQIEKRQMSDALKVTVEYFKANAWAALQEIRQSEPADAWLWEHPELSKQILHLRRAWAHPGFAALPSVRKCQILTNLANQMNAAGRFVDAIQLWDQALALNQNFAMALGNRGAGLMHYARALYDPGHQILFLRGALSGLHAALAKDAIWEGGEEAAKGPHQGFARLRDDLTSRLDGFDDVELDPDNVEHLGADLGEREYRRWCMQRRLFLNPLNDLWRRPIVARDVLTLPDLTTPLTDGPEPPRIIAFYNQIKQEYASARWLLFSGITAEGPHNSDRGVVLFNTLDYPIHGLAIEQVKIAYRSAYSLLDKIAIFINVYLGLAVPTARVSFRSIWLEKTGRDWVIRPEFARLDNWPLRGLFWLAKDLYEPDFSDVTDPDARGVRAIRNHLEHRFLRIHDGTLAFPLSAIEKETDDPPSMSVDRAVFEAKAIRLLQLTRSAVVYLSLAVRREEERRSRERSVGLVSMPLSLWSDDWKR